MGMGPGVWLSGVMGGPTETSVLQLCVSAAVRGVNGRCCQGAFCEVTAGRDALRGPHGLDAVGERPRVFLPRAALFCTPHCAGDVVGVAGPVSRRGAQAQGDVDSPDRI